MPIKKKAAKVVSAAVTAKVLAADLCEALDAVAKVALNVRNAAVYKCVLVTIRQNVMVVRGTNLVVFIERSVPVQADGEGIWLVTFEQFYHFVKNVSGNLSMTFGKSEVQVSRGRTKASAKLRDYTEFMQWPKWTSLTTLTGDAGKLIDAVRHSIPSVSAAFADPALYNISLKRVDGKSTDVQASNNHRYQYTRVMLTLADSMLIPLNAAVHLAEIQDAKKVAASDALIGVQFTRGRIYCNLSADEQRYPQFATFVPKTFSLSITVDKAQLQHLVTLAKGFADKKYRRLNLSIADKLLTISSSVKSGQFKSAIKIKTMKGKALDLLLDAEDLERFIELCGGDELIMQFTKADDQILLTDPTQKKFWFVAYPLIPESGEKKETADESGTNEDEAEEE